MAPALQNTSVSAALPPHAQRRVDATGELAFCYVGGDHEGMERALMAGAFPDCQLSKAKRTVLHDAAMKGDERAVNMILAWGGYVDIRDFEQSTPLFAAVRSGSIGCAKLLLEAGADPSLKDDKGNQPDYYLWHDANNILSGDAAVAFDTLLEDYQTLRSTLPDMKNAGNVKDRLFQYNRHGYALLDNPQTWKNFAKIEAALLESNMPISKEEWLDTNARGERWLDVALNFRHFGAVVRHMHRQHEAIDMADLLTDEGEATPFLNKIIEKGEVRHLFRTEQFQEGGMRDFNRLRAALPEAAQAQVYNFHVLQTVLNRQEMQRANESLGR